MKLGAYLSLTLLFISVNKLQKASADECNDFVKKLMLDQMKFIVPCIEKNGLTTSQQKKEKVMCIMKCVLIDAQMLASDGSVDFEIVNKLVEALPPKIKAKADTVFQECGGFAASIDPKEASCQSYSPLLTCLTDISVKLCE